MDGVSGVGVLCVEVTGVATVGGEVLAEVSTFVVDVDVVTVELLKIRDP